MTEATKPFTPARTLEHEPSIGAKGPRRLAVDQHHPLGTGGTMHGVTGGDNEPDKSDKGAWMAWAVNKLRGTAWQYGEKDFGRRIAVVTAVVEMAAKMGHEFDYPWMRDAVIRDVQATAEMNKEKAMTKAKEKQEALPETKPPASSSLFSKPKAELDAEIAAKKNGGPAPLPETVKEPEPTKPHDDLAEDALARAALHGDDAPPEPPAPPAWYQDDDNLRKFWQAIDKSAKETGFQGDAREMVLNRAGGTLDKWKGSGKELLDDVRELMLSQAVAAAVEPPAPEPTPEPAPVTPPAEQPITPPAQNLSIVTARTAIERVQPNRYWLNSPAWQIGPFDMAKFIVESGLYPNANTPAKAVAIMFKGLELGVSPLAAMEHIALINGKATIDGAMMLAMLRKEGVSISFTRRDDKACTVKMTRPDNGDSVEVTYSMEDANKAGLSGKDPWRKFPRAMMTWRAVSEAARLLASDIMIYGGIPQYTPEELDPDAVYDEDGRPVAVAA